MDKKEELKKSINESIYKIEKMIKENKSKEDIYKEKYNLDKLLSYYLKEMN